jgi:ABC-type multidrug transport system permease subunit
MTRGRAAAVPAVMILLSFFGVISAFSNQAAALLAWMVGLLSTVSLSHALGAWRTIRWSAEEQRLVLPGSWLPLCLILGLFFTKFGVNVLPALDPKLIHDMRYSVGAGFAYGAFSGAFLGRGVAMWRAARQTPQRAVPSDMLS